MSHFKCVVIIYNIACKYIQLCITLALDFLLHEGVSDTDSIQKSMAYVIAIFHIRVVHFFGFKIDVLLVNS